MKKLMMAALVAGLNAAMSPDVFAEEEASAPAVQAEKAVKKAVMTPEERRARREKAMAARKAMIEKKAVEVIKKYGLDDEKAKALFAELQKALRPMPMQMHMPRPDKHPVKAE